MQFNLWLVQRKTSMFIYNLCRINPELIMSKWMERLII